MVAARAKVVAIRDVELKYACAWSSVMSVGQWWVCASFCQYDGDWNRIEILEPGCGVVYTIVAADETAVQSRDDERSMKKYLTLRSALAAFRRPIPNDRIHVATLLAKLRGATSSITRRKFGAELVSTRECRDAH